MEQSGDAVLRVMPADLRVMITEILQRVDVPERDAARIAECLVQVDMRGVFSHGTLAVRRYVDEYKSGIINRQPTLSIVRESGSTATLDGGGGLGYLVATRATEIAATKALKNDIAMVGTHHHGHVGSLGIYARMLLHDSLACFAVAATRSWQPPTQGPDTTIYDAVNYPAMCFGIPSADGPPFVLDMNANLFSREALELAMQHFPNGVFKGLGITYVATLLGGLLAGALPAGTAGAPYTAATRGLLIIAFRPDVFGDSTTFRADVTRVIAESRKLAPMPGQDSAELAGTLEWQRERTWADAGVPLEPTHAALLEEVARELGVAVPW